MSKRNITVLSITLLCGLLMIGGGVWAMSSGSYAIDWDIIGGGGEPASPASYGLRGTIGQAAAESSFSTNYGLWSGYWYPAAPAAPDKPTIAFSPTSFAFHVAEGGANPLDQTLNIWNSGAGTLSWSVADDADWLDLDPPGGSSTGEQDAVTLSVDISGMTADGYSTTITVSAPGAVNTPQTVTVTLDVSVIEAPIAWDCPLGGQPLIAPNPGAGRPFLDVPAACTDVTVSVGAQLWGIYYLVETGPDAGTWLWYIPGFASSTLTQLEPGKYYWVVVSESCTLTIPQ
jgi:hypothetical protein